MLGNADDAEDAAQDVFLKAYQALPKFQPEASSIPGSIASPPTPASITKKSRS